MSWLFECYKSIPKFILYHNKDNVKYATLKELEKEEQLNIDPYKSQNSQNGLNCVRAYRCPELICDYKKEVR